MGHDLGGQQVEVVEVVLVEDLEVDALGAEAGVAADPVDHLVRGCRRGRRAQVVGRVPMASARRRTVASLLPQQIVWATE